MDRAKLKRIVLPDALISPSSKPGPQQRKLEGYRLLADALKSKQLISEWRLSDNTDQSTKSELQLREALTRTLSEHCFFGYIRPGSKLPHSHHNSSKRFSYTTVSITGATEFIKPNGTDWIGSTTAPSSGNWSVIPKTQSRILIFDLDVTKYRILEDGSKALTTDEERYAEVRRSIAYLETALGIENINSTYAQLSPSGGIHIFLLLPEGTDASEIPSAKISNGMRELAGIPATDWKTEFQGDIRSGASNGFILMAGSRIDEAEGHYKPLVSDPRWNDFKDYTSGRKLRILELPPSAVERLKAARRLDLDAKVNRKARENISRNVVSPNSLPLKNSINAKQYSRLIERLKNESFRSYHESRAQIYRALSCCGSNEAIAALCRDSGYSRDTYRNRELSDRELLADMESMARKGLTAERCGSHCSFLSVEADSSTPIERLDRTADSAALRSRSALQIKMQRASAYGVYSKRDPRGFDYTAVTSEILGERNFKRLLSGDNLKIAGYRFRALELAVGYFAPLFGAGASVAIASSRELTSMFGWSESQLREALRHLRSSGIITVVCKQVSGRASGYGPGKDRFYDPILSKRMKIAWGLSRVGSYDGETAFLGGLFDYARGKIVRPDGSSYTDSYLREVGGGFAGLLDQLSIGLKRVLPIAKSVVNRYLAKSLDHYIETQLSLKNETVCEAMDALDDLQFSNAAPLASSYLSLSDELWISRATYRKDKSAGGAQPFYSPESSYGNLGDRSPPKRDKSPPTYSRTKPK